MQVLRHQYLNTSGLRTDRWQRSKVVTAFDSNVHNTISNPFGGAGSSPAVVAFLPSVYGF
jgi:hypothetical protein